MPNESFGAFDKGTISILRLPIHQTQSSILKIIRKEATKCLEEFLLLFLRY